MNQTLYKEINIPPLLNPESIRSLSEQITSAENSEVRFLILKGSAEIFCKGLDLKWVATNERGDYMKEMQEYGEFLKKLQTGKCISIAVVSGEVSGGGMGIVCACDHVISTESATFSLPEGLLGLIPGMILPSLLNRISPLRIKKMVLTGQKYPAAKAYEWEIADDVTKADDLDSAITKAISSMKSCKREPVGDIKKLLYTSNINKDELALLGMKILNAKLNEPEIRERLQDILEFMDDE
ncbi:MAG: enoyl-CoA hydratase/isomerase family protein [Bacteroidota bacterium]